MSHCFTLNTWKLGGSSETTAIGQETASMTLDDLPKAMVEKYLERFRNATKLDKEKVQSCLDLR